jgi:hypothetical protein
MFPAIVAPSVEQTNYENIITAALDVAQNHAGLTFGPNATKLWEMPLPGEIEAASLPFLVVRRGDLEAWAFGGQEMGGDHMRLIGSMEPVWCFEVYVLYPYSDQNPNHQVAAQTLVALISAYTANVNLEGTCESVSIVAGKRITGLTYVNVSGTLYRAAKVTLRAYETLMVQYS